MIISKSDWSVVREKLESLFSVSFGRTIQPGYLDWRYVQNGQKDLLFSLELNNNEPVSSYSAAPVELVCDGEVFSTAISMTTMTHPQWQGKGLFPKLASELYAHSEKLQIASVWGFPNANSHLSFNSKLAWEDIYEIPTMTLDLAKVDASKWPNELAIERDDNFSFNYPEPPSDGLIRVHKTKDYLGWRYGRNPVNTYQNYVLTREGNVSSYVVVKSFGDGLDLVDIQPRDEAEARTLLSFIVQQSIVKGLRQIFCWAPTHHSVHGVLERMGFINSAPITYFGGRTLIPSVLPEDWLNYRNWYIQMGDSDVY